MTIFNSYVTVITRGQWKIIVSTIPNFTIVSCGFQASRDGLIFSPWNERWKVMPETTSFEDPNVDSLGFQMSSPASNSGGVAWYIYHFTAFHPWNYGNYWLFPLQHITQSYLVTYFWVISSPHSCSRSLRLYACRATNSCSILFYGYLMLT